ncbi:hypothetical protein HY490_04960 [Candidatus Woesearchaeota archaeon]|nr:hypothetical protein [Candidatus Woesearchaeota archaeon]
MTANETRKVLTYIGNSASDALEGLQRQLPRPEGDEAYEFFSGFNLSRLPDGTELATVVYSLKPGNKDNVARPGTGAFVTPMERRSRGIDDTL